MRNILSNTTLVKTVSERVLSLLNRRKNTTWSGTMTDLLNAITPTKNVPAVWPGSPSSLRRVVNTIVPTIRRSGYRVAFTRSSDHERTRVVSFTRVERTSR